jgi:ribosomal-protein-alanine N-acetyltransferase
LICPGAVSLVLLVRRGCKNKKKIMLQAFHQRLGAARRLTDGLWRLRLFGQAAEADAAGLPFETQRLLVRDASPADVDALHDYMVQEPFCRREHLGRPSRAQIVTLLQYCQRQQKAEVRSVYSLVAVLRETDAIIGHGRLRVLDRANREGKLALGIDWRYEAQRFETELGIAMLRFGFGRLGLHRIVAQCDVDDLATNRVFEKLGMRPEGVLRDNIHAEGRWWSSYQWSMLAPEHKTARTADERSGT